MHLFAYGTLMFPEIWDGVVGRRFDTCQATLGGFAIFRVIDGVYPVMVEADRTSHVEGVVYLDVDAESLGRLDRYESELYERRAIEVITDDGQRLECQAYVLPASRREIASGELWDRELFRREAMAAYLQRLNEA